MPRKKINKRIEKAQKAHKNKFHKFYKHSLKKHQNWWSSRQLWNLLHKLARKIIKIVTPRYSNLDLQRNVISKWANKQPRINNVKYFRFWDLCFYLYDLVPMISDPFMFIDLLHINQWKFVWAFLGYFFLLTQ